MKITTRHTWLMAVALLGAGPVGCSNNGDNNGGPIINRPNTNNTTNNNTGGTTTTTGGTSNNTNNNSNNGSTGTTGGTSTGGTNNPTTGTCVPADCTANGKVCDSFTGQCVDDSCSVGEDKGMVSAGMTLTLNGSNQGAGDVIQTGCSSDGMYRPEKIYRFTAQANLLVKATIVSDGGVNWAYEVRKGTCATGDDSLICFNKGLNDPRNFALQQGQEYFVVVEPNTGGQGSFEISMEFTPLACVPDSMECDSNDAKNIRQCSPGGVQFTSHACATSCGAGACEGGDCCEGNSAANPFVIDYTTLTANTYKGSPKAYTSMVDFSTYPFKQDETGQLPDCTPLSSEGFEVFFKITGVKSGDNLTFDAHNQPDGGRPADGISNHMYVLSAPPVTGENAPTCYGFKQTLFPEIYNWTADRDGDVWVVIDSQPSSRDEFVYRVCKGDCPTYVPVP